jgi:hypothetical protein
MSFSSIGKRVIGHVLRGTAWSDDPDFLFVSVIVVVSSG